MKKYVKILFMVLIPILGMAQQQYPDSLKKVLKITQADSTSYSALNGIGEYYVEINGDSALYYLNRALALAKKNDRAINEGATLARIGYVLIFKGEYPESLGCFQQALKLTEVPANETTIWNPNMSWIPYSTPQKTRLTILSGIHLLYSILSGVTGNLDEEIVQVKLSRALAKEAGDVNFEAVANMNLGTIYQQTNRLDSASMLLEDAARTFERTGYKKYLGGAYGQIGLVYLDKGHGDLAVQYFRKGLNVSIQQKNFALADFNYANLAKYYLSKKQKDSSLYYARKRLDLVHAMNSTNQDQAYEDLYRSYQLTGNIDSAYKYQGLALAARDKKYETTAKSLADFQKLSFKAQLRAQDLEKEKAAIQTRIRTYVLLAAIVVFMLIAGIFYRNNRQKQKVNNLLFHQNEEIVQQKEEIESQRDSLEQTLTDLKATQTQLIQSEKMASLGELTAGIAHEIQNPLNFVNNFSEVSRELMAELNEELNKGDTEEAKAISKDIVENLEKINHHGKRAGAIVKGMLQHSQSGSGKKEPTDINALADEYLRLAYHGLKAKDFNAGFITNFDDKLPKVNVIPQDIGRVMLNLFNNAFYAINQKQKTAGTDYKAEVSVSTSTESGHVVIKVKDNGTGMPDSIKEKIMQPFFTTKPTGEGTGLGLSLTYDMVVKGHGGSISVDTKEGEYTEFTVTLPLS